MQNDWAYNELRGADVWDPRCRNSLISACQALAEQAEIAFSRALGSRRKAVSHILHHEQTTAEDLLKGHIQATSLRCQNAPFVLVASDTTSFDFTSHPATTGLGHISDKEHQAGFLVHSALALLPEGVPLGLLYQHSWIHEPATFGEAKQRRKRPFEQKESHKWVDALRGVEAALPTWQKALLIQDSEADLFAFFSASRREGIDLLIRACQPRLIEVEGEGGPRTLFEAIAQAPVVATHKVKVRQRADREAREVLLTLRLTTVRVRPPTHGSDKEAVSVPLRVVGAFEQNPPEGVKEPIQWVLLTTLPVSDGAAAVQLVDYYARRWLIERFHLVLKSGCKFERLQLDTFTTLEKALSLYSIVAWRLLHLTYLAREAPDTPAREAVSSTQRQVLELAIGKPIATVAEVVLAVAHIGGFRFVPSAPVPGVKSLWLGFRKLDDMVAGFLLARKSPP